MMRLMIIVLVLLFPVFLTGCDPNTPNANTANTNSTPAISHPPLPVVRPEAPADPSYKPCNAYYPLVPGSQKKFAIAYNSGVSADLTVIINKREEKGQLIFVETERLIDNKGGADKSSLLIRALTCEGSRITIISEEEDNRVESYRSISKTVLPGSRLFFPESSEIKPGKKWSYDFSKEFTQSDGSKLSTDPYTRHFEVVGEEEITVPAGKFKALRVNTKVQTNVITDFYVQGIGLVKRVASSGGTNWSLKEYSGLQPVNQ